MMEKFSEMKYVRPDGEAYIRTIQKETKNFNEAADFEGAHQAFVAILTSILCSLPIPDAAIA